MAGTGTRSLVPSAMVGPVNEFVGMLTFSRDTFVALGTSIARGRFPVAEMVIQT